MEYYKNPVKKKKMKQIIILISICFLTSCSYRNEFGRDRVKFNIERIKPNTDETVYRIIDTSKIYYEISITDNFRKPVNFPGYKANYLKFYKNGRVAEFSDVDFEDENSFNPKKAKSYLYNYKKEKLIIQVYFKNPQCGQCFIKEKFNRISNDIFELENDGYISTYKAMEMPKSFLKFKPDW